MNKVPEVYRINALRILAGISAGSVLLSYLSGGVLLAAEKWAVASTVLVFGHVLAYGLFSYGGKMCEDADSSMRVHFFSHKRRAIQGIILHGAGLALLPLGPGGLAGLSAQFSGSLMSLGLVMALYGYYLTVSSYECSPRV